uniref:Fertility-related ORF1 protein n=1 Tax=Oryza meridionalis TaxID=40149 RepID=A0A2Z4GT92_9ORYZ|nr:fertility-related ORF1 protein [Oryza meridionalis]
MMTEIPHAATARLFPLTPAAAQMRILRRFPRLLRRSNAAARSPAPMHRLISSPSLMASAAASWCWWSPLLARGGPVVRRVSRFPWEPRNMTTISRVKGDESYRRLPSQEKKHTAITQGMKTIDTRGTILEARAGDEKSNRDAASSEVSYIKYDVLGQSAKQDGCDEDDRRSETEEHVEEDEVLDPEEYTVNNILPKSRHRDGSIYRDIMDTPWKREFHIADRNETRLEAMRFSNPTNCVIRSNGTCMSHVHCNMLQILSLELAKITLDGGSVELYGYIAVRDDLDPLLNYIVNCSRDDPIIVEQGSLINMEGPNRGIDMMDYALIEYDMRIKTGEQEKDDLQLIDGASMIGPGGLWNRPETICIPGDYGAVDITLSRFNCSAEATVEILISEVQSSFNLLLGCLTSDLDKEIRLFDGVISESRDLKRSVVAVTRDSFIDLKFEVGAFPSSFDQHYVSFKEKIHGYDTQEIKTDFALISVNVTWSTLPAGLK